MDLILAGRVCGKWVSGMSSSFEIKIWKRGKHNYFYLRLMDI
jgi:hypothetical protein